jgi:hypothetical protein
MIDIERLAQRLTNEVEACANLDAVELIVDFLVCIGDIDTAKRLVKLLQDTPCYNCAADTYITALLDDEDSSRLARARKEALELQAHIQSDDTDYECHPDAGLLITIACTTTRREDLRRAHDAIMKGSDDVVVAAGLLEILTHTKSMEDAQYIRRTIQRWPEESMALAIALTEITEKMEDFLLYCTCLERLLEQGMSEDTASAHIDLFITTAKTFSARSIQRAYDQTTNAILKMRIGVLNQLPTTALSN